jgi:hypothetical protein
VTAAGQDRETILADYVATREDERSFQTTQVALASIALTTLGALAGLVGRYVLPDSDKNEIPPGLLVGAPIVPLALFGMFVQAGVQATIRAHYLRDLEEQLAGPPIPDVTPSPSYIRMVGSLIGLKHGHPVYRAITGMLITIAISAFIVIATLIAISVPAPWAALMAVTYSFTISLLIYMMWATTARGSKFYAAAHRRLDRQSPGPPAGGKKRSLVSYLVLPRPEDLQKGLYYLAGFLLAPFLGQTTLGGPFMEHLLALVWGWFVLEFLAYQARYQWNDIRGHSKEASHPMASSRGRLPTDESGAETAIRVSGLVAIWRVVAAVVLAVGAPGDSTLGLLIGIAAIFALAVLYETARERNSAAGVIVLMALGYPLRFCLGLQLAGYEWSKGDNLLVAGVGILAFTAFGWSVVGLTWTLDAHETEVARGTLPAHLEWLLINSRVPRRRLDAYEPPLKRHYRILAFPNLAHLAACLFGVLFAQLAVDAPWSWDLRVLLPVLAAAMTMGLMLLGIRGIRTVVAFAAGLALLTALPIIVYRHWSVFWIPAIWVAFMAFYLGFRSSTYTDLTMARKHALEKLRTSGEAVVAWIVTGRLPGDSGSGN